MMVLLRTAAMVCLAGSLVVLGAATAGADDLCPMGGTVVKVAVDSEKAVEWLDDERRSYLLNDEDEWEIKTISDASDKIGIVLTSEYVFFGVADDREDREADEKRMSKAFGNDLKFLKGAVQKEIKAMWKAEVVDIGGGDVQGISQAVGIGTVAQDGRDWVLETSDCEGMTINLEGID